MLPRNKPRYRHQINIWSTFDWLWSCDLESFFERLWGRWRWWILSLCLFVLHVLLAAVATTKHLREKLGCFLTWRYFPSFPFIFPIHMMCGYHHFWIWLLCNVDFMAQKSFPECQAICSESRGEVRSSRKLNLWNSGVLTMRKSYTFIIIYLSPFILKNSPSWRFKKYSCCNRMNALLRHHVFLCLRRQNHFVSQRFWAQHAEVACVPWLWPCSAMVAKRDPAKNDAIILTLSTVSPQIENAKTDKTASKSKN